MLAPLQLDDFNDFAAPSGGSQSDFLARERELLGEEFGPTPGGLSSANDFNEKPRGSSAFPSLDDDDDLGRTSSPKVTSPTSSSAARHAAKPSSDFVSSFQRDPPPAVKPSSSVAIANDDEDGDNDNDTAMLHFQSQYPDLQPYPDTQISAPAPQQVGAICRLCLSMLIVGRRAEWPFHTVHIHAASDAVLAIDRA